MWKANAASIAKHVTTGALEIRDGTTAPTPKFVTISQAFVMLSLLLWSLWSNWCLCV